MAERNNQVFYLNLSRSHTQEQIFSHTLNQIGYISTTTQDKKSFPAYDVEATIAGASGTTIKYECKVDQLAHKTGNVAVELYKELDGKKYKAGLSATQSDYYAYSFPEDPDHFYLVHTQVLKNLIKTKQYTRIVWGGNGHYFKNALFPKAFFIQHCMVLKKIGGMA